MASQSLLLLIALVTARGLFLVVHWAGTLLLLRAQIRGLLALAAVAEPGTVVLDERPGIGRVAMRPYTRRAGG